MTNIELIGMEELQINETKKSSIYFLKLTPTIEMKEYVNHHILLADVSGSMSSSLKQLKEKIKLTLDALLQIPNSYVSVITYSGHNQSTRVLSGVKCDEITYKMQDVHNVVEKELYIKSVTVMSEPLEMSIDICKSLANVCDKHHIALFTDGCLVPYQWNEEKEQEKCFKIAEVCNKKGIYLNAIGFGQYYDRRFLKDLIEIAGNGSVSHIDRVNDYFETILNIIKKVNSENVVSINLKVNEGCIFNIQSSAIGTEFAINSCGGKNIIALIDTNIITVDGIDYEFIIYKLANLFKPVEQDIIDDFYYSMARFHLNGEDIDRYEFCIKLLGDTELFEKTANCYSFIEKGNAINKVTEALEDSSKRFLGGRTPIVEDVNNEKLCLLEILKLIMEDEDSTLYWDKSTPYHRITQKTNSVEDNISFTSEKSGLVPVTSLSIGSEKLNIGVKVRIDGYSTDNVSKFSREACIYRDYNIINGGNVNVPYINAKLSMDLYYILKNQDVLDLDNICDLGGDNIIFRINLDGIKSANKRVLKSMSMSEITQTLFSISKLKCKQWAINQVIKEVLGDSEKIDFSNLSIEELEIRKILRIDENGIYQPLSFEKDTTSPFEIYPAIHLTWEIAKIPEKAIKENYLLEMKSYVSNDKNKLLEFLQTKLNETRKEMREKEFKVNCVRIASAIMNKSPFIWEESIEKDKKTTDKILNRNMIVNGKIKINRKNVNDNIVEQKRWMQLIKCN